MDIDNDLYNRIADSWWDEKGVLWLLQTAMNPVRFEFFKEVLLNKLKISLEGKHTLDVGCGGGFLAEEFARLGCRVTGLDPSVPSLKAAKTHAKNAGLKIDYQIGKGEDIPFEGKTFDIVCCCDVLEHISDWQGVVLEISRVLKPNGLFFYDTPNRTFLSKLVLIKISQEWRWTSFMPSKVHSWEMFIKPNELISTLEKCKLKNKEIAGIWSSVSPFTTLKLFRRRKKGVITWGEMGVHLGLKKSNNNSIAYMGYAIKKDVAK